MATARHTQQTGRGRQVSKDGQATGSLKPIDDFVGYLRDYARENPEHMALWCLGIGFMLGWRLKPW